MFSFDFIVGNIAVGSCPKSATDIQLLSNAGITCIINLQSNADIAQRGIDLSELSKSAEALSIRIYQIPMIDFDDSTLQQQLPKSYHLLQRLLSIGHVVYIHCNAGIERAPTVAVNYFHLKNGLSITEAANIVTKKGQVDLNYIYCK